jgi:hypothetical protein
MKSNCAANKSGFTLEQFLRSEEQYTHIMELFHRTENWKFNVLHPK